ncbi:MAG: hypothetical protein EXR95_04160 [Gemmatimonadetes bacterium]|nr:hypothetical protein [Gemmatimonadota bacterium]
MKPPASLEEFFFRPIRARGFGLMRMVWACVAAAFLLMQWKDVAYYYSDGGIITARTSALIMRGAYRLSILDWASSPGVVFVLYVLMLGALLLMALGVWPRVTTAVSVLLIFSFHERNQMVLTGGDTLLRNIGFLMVLAPRGSAGSTARWPRLRRGATRAAASEATMPIWPWRLLLWQMVVLYGTSLWYKLLGSTWISGTAVEATFHHPVVARWPMLFMNTLMPVAGVGDYLMLCWQAAWLLLLVPRSLVDRLLPARMARIPLRRILILGGVVFHGGILLLLDAGVFPLAIFTAYVGLLREDDLGWLGALSLTPRFRSRSSRLAAGPA